MFDKYILYIQLKKTADIISGYLTIRYQTFSMIFYSCVMSVISGTPSPCTYELTNLFLWVFLLFFSVLIFFVQYNAIYPWNTIKWGKSNLSKLKKKKREFTKIKNGIKETSFLYILNQTIGLISGVFANGPGDRGSIPGRVIRKTQKWLLIPPCLTLSTIR